MLDIMTVPEMVGRLRKDVERDVFFISSGTVCASAFSINRDQHFFLNLGLEIIYNLSLAVTRQEWDFDLSEVSQSCMICEIFHENL